jgi:hypothetical protein
MGTVRMLLGVLAIGAFLFLGFKVLPPYFSNYQFEDDIKNEALQSTYTNRSEDDIRDVIVKKAHDYDIPITAKQVHVSRTGTNGGGVLIIEADYNVPLDLPGYSTKLEFHASTKNKGVF